MLISPMYHHINSDKYSNDYELFDQHLAYIAKNFHCVFPNDSLKEKNICLTFDDAYFDFYHFVFPLLQKHNLKAIVAVPTAYILDSCELDVATRLSYKHDECYNHKESFCTYAELRQMIQSGCVQVASHSHTHTNLTQATNLKEELTLSKHLLETNLGMTIESFIFPFGKYNEEVLQLAQNHYKYLFRIGNALNSDFSGIDGVIYRVNGDGLESYDEIFQFTKMMQYRLKTLIKKVTK